MPEREGRDLLGGELPPLQHQPGERLIAGELGEAPLAEEVSAAADLGDVGSASPVIAHAVAVVPMPLRARLVRAG